MKETSALSKQEMNIQIQLDAYSILPLMVLSAYGLLRLPKNRHNSHSSSYGGNIKALLKMNDY
jgi:hypothetical protein